MEYFQLFMVAGIMIGNILAIVIPYFRKLSEGKVETFDIKYLYHIIASSFWQSLVSLPLWLDWESPSGLSLVLAFILAVAFGFGGKDMQEQIYKFIVRTKPSIPIKPAEPST